MSLPVFIKELNICCEIILFWTFITQNINAKQSKTQQLLSLSFQISTISAVISWLTDTELILTKAVQIYFISSGYGV